MLCGVVVVVLGLLSGLCSAGKLYAFKGAYPNVRLRRRADLTGAVPGAERLDVRAGQRDERGHLDLPSAQRLHYEADRRSI